MTAIPLNDQAIKAVERHMNEEEDGRSSHWRLEQHRMSHGPDGFKGVGPIGTYSIKTGMAHTIAHYVLQTPFRRMGRGMPGFGAMDRAARAIAKRQGRAYDGDLQRHVLTLGMLRRHLDIEGETDPIAVIGDGYANMASVLLASLSGARVILINLAKTLWVDFQCLRRGLPDVDCALVRTPEELSRALEPGGPGAIGIMANDCRLIGSVPLSLAINIQSMMEMDPPVTARYFDLMRACPRRETAFYCCNNEEKRLPDGTVSRFVDYPWREGDKILVDEICPWLRYRYADRPPFYVPRRVNLHRLVMLEKGGN